MALQIPVQFQDQSDPSFFRVPSPVCFHEAGTPELLAVSVGREHGWEYATVSTPYRCPTWPEMAYIKTLFWDPEDVVLELHPSRSRYINVHPYCLWLWRPIHQSIPMPPVEIIGDPSKWSDEQIRQYRLWAELHDGNTLVHYKDDPTESYSPRSGRGRRSA